MKNSTLSQAAAKRARQERQRRDEARAGLLGFTAYTKRDYAPSWHHVLLCDCLDAFARGEIPRLMINMPPRHGKSELASRRLPARLLGVNPDLSIIACSHTASLASAMNRDVQRVLVSPQYARLYPNTTLSTGKRDTGSVQAARNSDLFEIVGHRGCYRCAGVGGSIVGQGFDVGIIDDPIKSREEADSPTVRDSTWAWYTGDFYTRRGPNARILVIATRWHPEDLCGRLLRAAEDDLRADQWTVLSLPAIASEVRSAGDRRQPGEALWPERYPLAELEKTRAANPYDWWSQYQQQPRAPGSTEWPESYFNGPGFWFDDWPAELWVNGLRIMSLDPSKGRESKPADYQALILYARDKHGGEWVEADLSKRPMTAALAPDGSELSEGMVETAFANARWFKPETLALEVNGFQELLRVPFALVAARYKMELSLSGIDNTVNKLVRIRRLGEPLALGKMRFRRTPGTRLLVEQLRQFPNADHDDGPDALEMARRRAIEIWNGRQPGARGPTGWRV